MSSVYCITLKPDFSGCQEERKRKRKAFRKFKRNLAGVKNQSFYSLPPFVLLFESESESDPLLLLPSLVCVEDYQAFTQSQVKSQAIPMHADPTYVGYCRSLRTKGGKKTTFHSLGASLSHCQEMSTLILSIPLGQTSLNQTLSDQTLSDQTLLNRATTVAVGVISFSISCIRLDRNVSIQSLAFHLLIQP